MYDFLSSAQPCAEHKIGYSEECFNSPYSEGQWGPKQQIDETFSCCTDERKP